MSSNPLSICEIVEEDGPSLFLFLRLKFGRVKQKSVNDEAPAAVVGFFVVVKRSLHVLAWSE